MAVAVKVAEDGAVVVARHCECGLGEFEAIFFVRLAFLGGQQLCQRSVFLFGGDDDDVLIVLGGGADERNAADVDFLDYGLMLGSRCHRGFERIEVHDDKVDLVDAVFAELLQVGCVVATRKDAAEHARMQRLDAPAQD